MSATITTGQTKSFVSARHLNPKDEKTINQ